jgi:hypothetical protein
MKKTVAISLLFLHISSPLTAQYAITVLEDAESLQELIPAAVYYPEDFQDFSSLEDFLLSLPGMKKTVSGFPSFKGVGNNSYSNVALFINGVKFSQFELKAFPVNNFPLTSVKMIELVKNGGNYLFGDTALAGAVNIVLAETDSESPNHPLVRFQGDSFLGYSAGVQGGGDWGFLQFDYENNQSPRENDQDQGINLFYNLKEKSWALHGHYWGSLGQDPGDITEAQYLSDPNQSDNDNDTFMDQGGTLGLHWDVLPDLSLSAASLVRLTTFDTESFSSYSDKLAFQQDLAMEYRLGPEALTLTLAGSGSLVNYFYDSFNEKAHSSLKDEMDFYRLTGGAGANLRWTPQEDLRLVLGGRWDGHFLNAAGTVSSVVGDYSNGVYSAGGSLSWEPGPWDLSLSGSKGFRFPLIDEMLGFQGFSFLSILEPEDSLEAAAALGINLGPWRLEADGFILQKTNEITYSSTEFKNVNLGESLRYGGGASVKWFGDGLEWVTGYQYLDGNQDGDPIALLSPHKVSTSLKFFLGEHLSFSALGAYQSDYDYGAPSGPGFAQFELGAGAQLDIPSENLLLSLSMGKPPE